MNEPQVSRVASRYFIRGDYVENRVVKTRDAGAEEGYWNYRRRRAASYYQWPVYEYAKQLIRPRKVRRCIDVGCGIGVKLERLSRAYPDVDFIGIDQPSAIRYCKKVRARGEWYADDIEDPSLELNGLVADLVICSDVIEHVEDPDTVLKYLKTRLERGGCIVLSTPERDIFRGGECNTCPNPYHVREWNSEELGAYLESHSFRIREHFLQIPVRIGLSRFTYSEVIERALRRKPVKYNQVCLLDLGSDARD